VNKKKVYSPLSEIRKSLSGESDWLAHCPREKVISRVYVFIHEEKDNLPPRDGVGQNGGLSSKQRWRCGTITHSNRQVSMYFQMLVTRFGKKSKKTTFCG
jgi:hypothetical protein